MAVAMTRRRAGNLPAEVTSFVGRRQELAEAKRLLSAGRIVTFTGVGGVGKTRLALRVAAEVQRAFPNGVWWVDLAPLVAGELLAQTVAGALGLQSESGWEALPEYLANKRLLLVLDNCEHLLDECAVLASKILGMAPELRILATSRQVLHVEGEHILDVPPLSVSEGVPANNSAQHEAVSLFAERAAAVLPDFAVNAANHVAVTRLCRRLDGIPLAVELAAVWMRALSVEQILDRLDDRFSLLARGSPAAVPRQKTLRALIDWSYDLCSPEEQRLWERLSVFSGGCDLEAAERVCSGDGIAPGIVLDVVTGLLDKSILLRKEHGSGVRYEMLETLRQYGRERLAESGQETALRRRHRDWCRDLALRGEAEWFGEHQLEWITRIRSEQANVVAALEFCLSEKGEAWAAVEIAAAMWSHRLSWSSLSAGHHWLERALALEPGPSVARAKALWVEAWLVLLRGEPTSAAPLLEESCALAEQLGDEAQLASAVQIAGFAALLAGDLSRAFTLLEQALARHRAVGDQGRAWIALFQLSMAAVLKGDPRSAALCAECLEMCERVNAQWSLSYSLWVSGLNRWRCGDLRKATTMIRDAVRLKLPYNDHLGIAQCIEVLAWIAADERQDKRAAELLGAAHMVWRSIGTSLPGLGHLAGLHNRCEARLRQNLGDEVFTAAHARGSELTLDRAVGYAADEKPAKDIELPQMESALTRRELEIAGLVAQGLSNKEIAGILVIAQRTAEGHVEHILRKLGFTSRSQIAAWAAQQQTGT
jgi:predicted ATPase/DNA-binding CsgD family transcriptional regulator